MPLPPYYILIFLLKIEILARPSAASHLKWGEMGQFLRGRVVLVPIFSSAALVIVRLSRSRFFHCCQWDGISFFLIFLSLS